MASVDELMLRYLGISRWLSKKTAEDYAVKAIFGAWAETGYASSQDIEFENVKDFSETEFYHRAREIAQVAARKRTIPEFRFQVFDIGTFEALYDKREKENLILIDGALIDFWFGFFSTRLFETYISAENSWRTHCNQLSQQHLQAFIQQKDTPRSVKDQKIRTYADNPHLSGVAASLSRVISYYAVCHEIAHMVLEHQPTDDIYATELEADSLAADIFCELRQAGQLDWASIPDGYLGAPVLFFELLNSVLFAHRQDFGRGNAKSKYPPPRLRRDRLMTRIGQATELDIGVCRDLRQSINRLNVYIKHQRVSY